MKPLFFQTPASWLNKSQTFFTPLTATMREILDELGNKDSTEWDEVFEVSFGLPNRWTY